jgi:phosphatidylglycerol:prolipoprotein diacylglycerol transferase
MHPYLFQLGSYPVASFQILVPLAFILAFIGFHWAAGRRDVSVAHFLPSGLAAILAGTVGTHGVAAVIYATSGDPHVTFQDGLQAFTDLGFFLVAQLGIFLYCRWRGVSALALLDGWAFGAASGIPVGRVGCLLGGCCFGKPTDLPWGIVYTIPGTAAFARYGGIPVHPTPVYMSLGIGLLWVVLLTLIRRRSPVGTVYLTAWTGYALTRITVEWFRADAARGSWLGGWFTSYQMLCLGVLVCVIPAGIRFWRPGTPEVPAIGS